MVKTKWLVCCITDSSEYQLCCFMDSTKKCPVCCIIDSSEYQLCALWTPQKIPSVAPWIPLNIKSFALWTPQNFSSVAAWNINSAALLTPQNFYNALLLIALRAKLEFGCWGELANSSIPSQVGYIFSSSALFHMPFVLSLYIPLLPFPCIPIPHPHPPGPPLMSD